jgi:two-component sensor histidine kinase
LKTIAAARAGELAELASRSREELGDFELTSEWSAVLLDPQAWKPTLETYGCTMRLAVALTDRDGSLLGQCQNPQATWRMVQQARPPVNAGCPFCLVPPKPCTAVVDAIATRGPVMVLDGAGLAHVAVPLALRGRSLGALIAGQVFNHYPEPLRLQRAAREFEISPQRLWHEAIQERPASRMTLQTYANLLMAVGQAFVGDRYATILHGMLAEANKSINHSLREKEILLREIQHRVKNNLAIVSSLLSMQSIRLDQVRDASAVEVLSVSQQRIQTMSCIHDLLYDTESIGQIDLAEYVKSVAETVIAAFQTDPARIIPRFDLASVPISIAQATPCGLIVNELITNVFKYAYPGGGEGEINFGVGTTGDGRISLTIADHGRGIPAGVGWQRSESLGLVIIRTLTEQLHGTIDLDTSNGVSVTIRFPQHDFRQ